MLKVISVVGARPNFMKVAPIVAAMRRRADEFAPIVVHTGQHYDVAMSDAFFRDLGMPQPDVYLNVGSGSHAAQTAAVMQRFEPVVAKERPDWVLVVGDVNSTLACALVSAKLHIKVAHVEAGLRSRDREMPEEINRVLTDQISDLLLTPSLDANENLLAEGIAETRIRTVGNVMIDSLLAHLSPSANSTIREDLGITGKAYAVLTLHRPSNVDERETLARILDALEEISRSVPIIFPVHPRTRARLDEFHFAKRIERNGNLHLIEPLGYLDFLRLYSGATLVLTDSGGLQEETTALGIPCLTLRENTERPVTVTIGTNVIVGTNAEKITHAARVALESLYSSPSDNACAPMLARATSLPPLWDGKSAPRILDALITASN